MHGQGPGGDETVGRFTDRLAMKGDLGILAGIEEVGAAEMVVPIVVAGIEALGLDGDPHRGIADLLLVIHDGPGKILKGSLDVADHHVLDGELKIGVGWIDIILSASHCGTRERRQGQNQQETGRISHHPS